MSDLPSYLIDLAIQRKTKGESGAYRLRLTRMRLESSRSNQAFAIFQSRAAVCGEICRTAVRGAGQNSNRPLKVTCRGIPRSVLLNSPTTVVKAPVPGTEILLKGGVNVGWLKRFDTAIVRV